MSKSSQHYQKAKKRAGWIWERYNEKGYVTSLEIRREFNRPGIGLDKEIMKHGFKLPPIMTEQEALALRQSQALMKVSNGEPMTTREIAAALGVNYTSVKDIKRKLIDRGLPCPAMKLDRKQSDGSGVKLPDDMRERVSTRYPSYLQAISYRYIEIDGVIRIAYLLW